VLWVLGVVWTCAGLLLTVRNAPFTGKDGFDG
jgi:hypothetical protein